jgi:hypothetical protein
MRDQPSSHKRRPLLIAHPGAGAVIAFGVGGLFVLGTPRPQNDGTGSQPATGDSSVSQSAAEPAGATSPGPATPTPFHPTASPSLASATIPLVPIVSYWSTQRSIARSDLARLISGVHAAGPSPSNAVVAASSADLPALAAALGVTPQGVQAVSAADVRARVKAKPDTLGIVRADDVTMDVRALAVDGAALFGAERIHDLSAWPLLVAEAGATSNFSTTATWTVAAGGDVMLDKAVYAQSVLKGKGADYACHPSPTTSPTTPPGSRSRATRPCSLGCATPASI